MTTFTEWQQRAGISDVNNLRRLADHQLAYRGQLVHGRFMITNRLSASDSGFGQLWQAEDQQTQRAVVVKMEAVWPHTTCPSTLPLEEVALRRLNRDRGGCSHVLQLICSGELTGSPPTNYIVLPLAGPDLRHLQQRMPGQLFTLGTAYRLGIQELTAIREVHERGWLHRDVKPANFVIDPSRPCHIFLIDFGMAAPYRKKDGRHRIERPQTGFHGSPRFASLNTHQFRDLSRRDDVWSMLYVLLSHVVKLPWHDLYDKDQIFPVKRDTVEELVSGRPALHEIYERLMKLEFYDRPDYEQMMNALRCDVMRHGVSTTSRYDWHYCNITNAAAVDSSSYRQYS